MPFILLILITLFFAVPEELRAGDYAKMQIAEFARTRSEAGLILKDSPEITVFLLKAFRGDFTSIPLAWNADEPQGNAYAENTPDDDNAFILLRVSAKLSPVDQVAALVYECRNAQNEKKFAKFIREAYLGSLAKPDFINSILSLEHLKMKETRSFLVPIQPFKDLDISKTEFYRKMVDTPEGFDDFIAYLHRIKRPDYDVFDMYSKFYDFLTITPQKRKAEVDAARAEQEAALERGKQPAIPQGQPLPQQEEGKVLGNP